MSFELVKQHKRLWIRDTDSGERVYTPPDFLQIVARDDFNGLLDELNQGRHFVDAITAFERHARIRPGFPGSAKLRALPSPT